MVDVGKMVVLVKGARTRDFGFERGRLRSECLEFLVSGKNG